MMPLMLFPQLLLCGLLVPRDELPTALAWLSWLMPLSYSIDAASEAVAHATITSAYVVNVSVVLAFIVAALAVGGLTLRRQTP
jgi:ABC-2 type transport system permease protein